MMMGKLNEIWDSIEKAKTSIKVNYAILLVLGFTTTIFIFYGDFLDENVHIAGSSILLGFISGMWIFHLVGVSFSTVEKQQKTTLRVPTRINYSLITIAVTCSLLISVRISFTGIMTEVMSGFIIMIAILTLFFGILLNYLGYFVDNNKEEELSN